MRKKYQRKIKFAIAGRHIKWAPFWAVIKKFGQGKKVHPSQMTKKRRHWRITKLKIKPRRMQKKHLG